MATHTLTLTTNIPEVSPSDSDTDSDREDFQEDLAFAYRRRGCCFWFPCFPSRQSNTVWERIATTPDQKEKEESSSWSWDWWDKGLNALKKVRGWSELVAGPKWKTFIRRFNKGGRGGIKSGAGGGGKFQYDPLSYALNFDDGPAQNGSLFEDDDRIFRDFSSRYASIPAKSLTEVGKDSKVKSFT